MFANHFKSSATVNRLASGPAAPFLEGFVQTLEVRGYADSTIQYHVCAVHHLCSWASAKAIDFATFDEASFKSFLQHPDPVIAISQAVENLCIARGSRLGCLRR